MRILLSLLFVVVIFIQFPTFVSAQSDFSTHYDLLYSISPSGTASVRQDITLTNLSANVFATKYSILVNGQSPFNVSARDQSNILPTIVVKNPDGSHQINVNLQKEVVGKGNSQTFTLFYDLAGIVEKVGKITQVRIPRTSFFHDSDSLNIRLEVPSQFGKPAFISPQPNSINQSPEKLFLNFKNPLEAITLSLGEFQIFDFRLDFHLQNPTDKPVSQQIALPPDTAYQKVFIESFTPSPENVTVDQDGNWIAHFPLTPRQTLDIKTQGYVHTYAYPQSFTLPPTDPSRYLSPSQYWPSLDPQVISLARKLKNPKDIYDFVVTSLKYDYNRLTQSITRIPSTQVLANPNQAACLEFTDLFITLARSANIPARELNGFGFTNNSQLRPLSLVSDILHAWPEYYDYQKSAWIQIDPTWAHTTKGQDYFNKLDTDHIVFAIHGLNPHLPKPAGDYKISQAPQKDVHITVGNIRPSPINKFDIDFDIKYPLLPFLTASGRVQITNQSSQALYNLHPTVHGAQLNNTSSPISVLPPFGRYPLGFSLQPNVNPFQTQDIIFSLQDQTFSYQVPLTQKLLIYSFVPLLLIILISTLIIVYSRKKHSQGL